MVLCVSSVTVAENPVDNTAAKQTDNDGQKDRQSTVNKMEVTICFNFCVTNLDYQGKMWKSVFDKQWKAVPMMSQFYRNVAEFT